MTCVLLEKMDLPESCMGTSVVYKKLLLAADGLTASDKKLIRNDIQKVMLHANLTPETINIKPYRDEARAYEEVQIMEAVLTGEGSETRIAQIIMRSIPYPVVLQLTRDERIRIALGHTRTSLSDKSRNTIEEFLFTGWIDPENLDEFEEHFFSNLHSSKLPFTNFYRFYDGIVSQVILLNASRWAGSWLVGEDIAAVKQTSDRIEGLEDRLAQLRSELARETMFNRKVGLNVEIMNLMGEMDNLRHSFLRLN